MRLGAGVAIAALAATALTSCGASRQCDISDDCFRGEVCGADGLCTNAPVEIDDDAGRTTGQSKPKPDSGHNTGDGGGNASNDAANGKDNGHSENVACIIDPFDYTCAEDEWEENDGYDPQHTVWDTTPWLGNSWCDSSSNIVAPRSLDGTLCAADRGDAFRFYISNPCDFTGRVKITITVTVHTACDPSLYRVEPYNFFFHPPQHDLCANDDNVRCTSSGDGSVHTIEWLFDAEQSYDPRVQIMANDPNLHLDYTIEVEVDAQRD